MQCSQKTNSLQIAVLVCDHLLPEIQTQFGDYPALIGNLLVDAGKSLGLVVKCDSFYVIDGQYPAAPQEYDAVVLSGSKYSAYDQLDWINRLKQFVRDTDALQTKIIGICFGHQIIAEALGGQVSKNPLGWEVGFTRIRLSQEDTAAQLGLQSGVLELCLQSMHQDHVTVVPKGFTVLASTDISNVQIMSKGYSCLSLQAHPEFCSGIVRHLINVRTASGVFEKNAAKKWLDVVDNQTDGTLFAASILWFIRQPSL
ncbi:hypothetical protein BATDEDRAFT_86199 [Batrachochytrium dendrobatidis JAM81]|uniref:Glutamine amidotransferase domain-containing protein n=2 Tax=Batrachochytrium dendrobatidis TaxID=109871 RepID=F4NW06_BATDJ|nr:uncharacterized protein BATDEDRAFT_86199 [Batrachochytrium dendrobatidis JAM81]EGF82395.1 hypothetical protein BATDEDRAFT_86199 [Batrachochytrium dendrobatidis JAM81]OAJ39736.1 hypothetical protein BDEG_23564 [Batrachochytrium dendrobatidis JEL423]|eukprot:XP_006676908.1 hypothetical protein BATDEDRAFT_86199 [Batrachochytrium dendrobatidis JAM81]